MIRIIKWIKRRKTIKRVNRALNIELTDWQIDFIFKNRHYPYAIYSTRANGKTLAHILRICLKTDAKIPEPLIFYRHHLRTHDGEGYLGKLPPTARFLRDNAGEDFRAEQRMRFFVYELKKTYYLLSEVKGIKLRKIEFR